MNEDVQYKLKRAWEQTKGTVMFLFTRFLLFIGKVLLFVERMYYRFHQSPTFRAQLWPKFLIFGSYVQKYTLISLTFIRQKYSEFILTPFGKRVQETVVIVWSVIVRLFVNLKSCLPAGMAYIVNLHLMTPPLTKEKKKVWAVIGAIGIVVFVLLNIYTFRYGVQLARKWEAERIAKLPPAPTPTPMPPPRPFGYHGKINFSIQGGGGGPRFGKGSLDPYDVAVGTNQILTLPITSDIGVASVSGAWKTDHKTTTVRFRLKDGTKQKGTWEAVWQADDTILYWMDIQVTAYDSKGTTNSFEMSLR